MRNAPSSHDGRDDAVIRKRYRNTYDCGRRDAEIISAGSLYRALPDVFGLRRREDTFIRRLSGEFLSRTGFC